MKTSRPQKECSMSCVANEFHGETGMKSGRRGRCGSRKHGYILRTKVLCQRNVTDSQCVWGGFSVINAKLRAWACVRFGVWTTEGSGERTKTDGEWEWEKETKVCYQLNPVFSSLSCVPCLEKIEFLDLQCFVLSMIAKRTLNWSHNTYSVNYRMHVLNKQYCFYIV